MTMTSWGAKVCDSALSMASMTNRPMFRHGMITEILGKSGFIGSWIKRESVTAPSNGPACRLLMLPCN